MVGDFGGELFFDYSAHGDAINTAARLESVNKYLGTRICSSAATAIRVPDFSGRPAGTLVLKGKTEGLTYSNRSPLSRTRRPQLRPIGKRSGSWSTTNRVRNKRSLPLWGDTTRIP